MKKRPIVLCIMDGYGLTDRVDGNAVKLANTPNLDDLMAMYPTTTIKACGNAVGLPEGQMGNSEVGHMNMGAGRIIYQELTKITKSIEDGDFFENKALLAACENVKKNDSALHLMGLVSDGGVHSSYYSYLWKSLNWQRDRESKRFMYTVSWMVVIHHRHQARSM